MNFLDIGLAFVEGLGLIVSPCILPVLPLVLSASIDGGKRRPYGIIAGFVLAFSLFVLGARTLVTALNINLDYIKYGSLALLFLFGVVLLSEKLSLWFSEVTQGAADFGSRFGNNAQGGFVSGMGIGALIGLVWTPCAGPILAAVLVQVIRQQTDAQSVLVTLAFALGASVPMFIITMAGRTIMSRLRFFTTHAETVRKVFGVIILFAVVVMAFGSTAEGLIARAPMPDMPQGEALLQLQDGLAKPYAAPEFAGIAGWLNSKPLTMKQLRGKVVLVDFWTYSCINCVRTLPYITGWDKKYRDKGLVIIGVHSPEFEFEKNIDNVKMALPKYGIQYAVAIDNDLTTWLAYDNRYWPAHYLIDKQGRVVYTHFGEGKYEVTENNIRYLLGLKDKVDAQTAAAAKTMPATISETPETYLGYERAERFASVPDKLEQDTAVTYQPAYFVPDNNWALRGNWKASAQKISPQEKGSTLVLNFKAKKVFIVMGNSSRDPAEVTIKLDGQPIDGRAGKDVNGGTVTVKGHALYELVSQPEPRNGMLEITADGPGVEMYAFTFGE